MQAVILAAGKGTRLGELTKDIPKPLLKINQKPILEYTLEALPEKISEAVIVIGHLGEQIKKRFSESFGKIKLTYVEQKELSGTAGALWQTQSFLKDEFLVLNGDDIYDKKELEKCLEKGWAIGLANGSSPADKYLSFELNNDSTVKNWSRAQKNENILMATGAYFISSEIFKYEPVEIIATGELGLPQTILKTGKQLSGIIMNKWIQINYPEDILKAEKKII